MQSGRERRGKGSWKVCEPGLELGTPKVQQRYMLRTAHKAIGANQNYHMLKEI